MSPGRMKRITEVDILLKQAIATTLLLAAGQMAHGEIHSESFIFGDGERTYEAHLARPEGLDTAARAVLLVHQWMGPTKHERQAARRSWQATATFLEEPLAQ